MDDRRKTLQTLIARTAGALDTRTRTMRVEADIDNRDGRLAPGMYAQVTVKIESPQPALLVPSKALRSKDKEVYVFTAQDDLVKSVPVTVGRDDGIKAEIASGLSGDEWVITAATSALSAGTSVTARPAQASP